MNKALLDDLLEAKNMLDAADIPLEPRTTTLYASSYPKEFKKGESMIFGIRIKWIDDLNE